MANYNNIQFVDYVKKVHAKNNDTVYMLSGIGRKLTKSMVDARIKRGDKLAISNQKLLYDSIGKYVYDCVGLAKSFFMTKNKPFGTVYYETKYDQNVRMMWNAAKEKGEVNNEAHPDIPGLLVMTNDLGHVGIYIGIENGKRAYIECTVTGKAWKVIKSFGYKGKKHTWGRWAKYSFIDYVKIPVKPDDKPDNKPTFKPYNVFLKKGTKLYNDSFKEYSLPISRERTVSIIDEKNGYGRFNDTSLKGTNHAWVKLTEDKPKPDPKPSTDIKVGDTVTVNGRLFISSNGNIKGVTNHNNKVAKVERIIKTAKHKYYVQGKSISGWADLSHFGKVESNPQPKPVVIKVGDKVKIKQGSMYQGAAKGKPVTTYALNKTCTIDRIDKGNARLQPINSWVALNDLVRV